jgi:hypothetical protein
MGFLVLSRATTAGIGEQSCQVCALWNCRAVGALRPACAEVQISLKFQGMGWWVVELGGSMELRASLCAMKRNLLQSKEEWNSGPSDGDQDC